MIRLLILPALLLMLVTQLEAQTPMNITIKGELAQPGSLRAPCPDYNAGTISFDIANFTGQSNDVTPDTIYLCFGDTLGIIHNGNFLLNGDPNPATPAGIGYAFYDCPPTVDGPNLSTVLMDPCLNQTNPIVFSGISLPQTQGIWVAVENINGNLNLTNTGFHQEAFNMGNSAPVQLWFAPITVDNAAQLEYESGGPCVSVSVGEAFSVVYLEPVEVTGVFPKLGPGLQGGFTLDGGLPEFDPAASYSSISITHLSGDPLTGTLQTPNPAVGDTIRYTVPRPGRYLLTAEDGKSCAAVDTLVMPVLFSAGSANGTTGDTVCVAITVDNLVDVTNIQFTLQWDPAVLRFIEVQNLNTAIPALDNSSFNTAPAGGGVLPFAWLDFLGGSNTLPDGSTLFEVCFEVLGSEGQFSNINFVNSPTDIQVGSVNNNPDRYPFELEPGRINVTSSVLLIQATQDSVSCAGLSDGAINLTVTGGIAPYVYTWNTFPATGPENGPFTIPASGGSSVISNLPAGNYRVIVADSDLPANLDTVFIEVFQGPQFAVNVAEFMNPTCNGLSDGALIANVSIDGVLVPSPQTLFTFQWNIPGQTNQILSNIPFGTYSVTVTDANGCQEIDSGSLSQPGPLQILANNTFITNATCSGSMDGVITVGATGGTPNGGNYTYAWSGSLGTVVASTSTVSNLNPGVYMVTVTDNNGCALERTFTVAAAKTLSINAIVTDITCFGANDGQIQASGSTSGAPPFGAFTYAWSSGQNVSTISNLGPGNYVLTLTDSDPAGCQAVATYEVVQPAMLLIQNLGIVNESCTAGGGDGRITIGVTGGTYPYTYNWSDGQTDSIAINLVAGTYTVDVRDANGCTTQASFQVTAPTPPSIDLLENDTLACAADTNGSLMVAASPGGAPIASFAWSNGGSGTSISNLMPGIYMVTVTANDACFSVGTAEVIAPEPLVLDSIVSASPNCPGDSNGSLTVFASGGTAPYRYIWGMDTLLFNLNPGLAAGTYNVSVIDANNCPAAIGQGTVVDPPSIVVNLSNIQGVSCFEGVCDGRATASAMYSDNSSGLFTFIWPSGEMNAGVMSSAAVQLCKGEQTVVVTDVNGCFSTAVANIPNPEDISINASINDVTCNGTNDGSISLMPSGGTPGYTYSWVHSGQTSPMVSGLGAGTFTVNVTDANGCLKSQELVVNEPDELILSLDQNITRDASCFDTQDGIIAVQYNFNDMINPVGNAPYTWSANVPPGSASPTSPLATRLPAGTYSVTITDLRGCESSLTYTVAAPPQIVAIVLDPEDPLCFNSTTRVFIDTIYGGVGTMLSDYQYMVDNNGILLPPNVPAEIFGDGDHTVQVFDPNGCSTVVTVNINQPEEIRVTFPENTVTVELGDTSVQLQPIITPLSTQVASYAWTPSIYLSDPAVRNPFVRPLESLRYELTVVDINGCEGFGTVFVELDARRNLYIPNAFSPNGDGANDEFRIYPCNGVSRITAVNIFDRWGDQVYQSDAIDASNAIFCAGGLVLWDGRSRNKTMNMGVYVYVIEVEFLDNVRLVYRGDISIVR
jgi:gliding motility-associated-like protein